MTKLFKKSKKTFLGVNSGPFCPNFGKNKKEFCQFLNISIIYHCAKNQKKAMTHSWEKCKMDKLTEKDRQQQ